jgi:hypothetical protein
MSAPNNIVHFDVAKAAGLMEQVLIRGDLDGLTHEERARYYTRVCQSLGLNPLTQPFDYIRLNGKLKLYALKGCTDQLRQIRGVSAYVVTQREADGLYSVHVRVRDMHGREDEDFGVVTLPKEGDARANAIMKAITKAKRRATLSLCGLGMLDETELETIPESAKRAAPTKPRTVMPAPKTRLLEKVSAAEEMNDELPGDLAPPKQLDTTDHGSVPAFLDRRKANGAADASFVDLVGGADA